MDGGGGRLSIAEAGAIFNCRPGARFSTFAQKCPKGFLTVRLGGKVEGAGPLAMQPGPGFPGNVGKPRGDFSAAAEAGVAEPFAEGILHQIGPVAAIEDEDGPRVRCRGPRPAHEPSEPADAKVERRVAGAPDRNGLLQGDGDGEGRRRLIQVVDDDGFRHRRRSHPSLPRATAVSLMRLEKPHSLSYQERTRTNLPSITWVCFTSKVELAGLWLKSLETSG